MYKKKAFSSFFRVWGSLRKGHRENACRLALESSRPEAYRSGRQTKLPIPSPCFDCSPHAKGVAFDTKISEKIKRSKSVWILRPVSAERI